MNNLEAFNPSRDINACFRMSERLSTDFSDRGFKKLEKKVNKLIEEDFSSLSFQEFKQVTKTLSSIKKTLDSIHSNSETTDKKIAGLSHDLIKVKQKLKVSNDGEINVPQREKVDVTIGILSDFEIDDSSGEVAGDFREFLKKDMPFIATGTLASGSLIADINKRCEHLKEVSDILQNNQWEIYELTAKDGSRSGLFVFLPSKKIQEGEDPLKKYDLAEGRLNKVAADKVLNSQEKPKVKSLAETFSASPEKNKIFYLVGHGQKNSAIGGVSKDSFKEMMHFFKTNNCKGLLIDSCFVGGTNSETFSNPLEPTKFPVVLSATGDFVVYPHRSTLQSRLDALQHVVENPLSTPTAEGFRQNYQSIQKKEQLTDYDQQSLLQVYFPSPSNVPAGFRSVGEGEHIYPITIVTAKKAEISKKTIQAKGEILGVRPSIVSSEVSFPSGSRLHSTLPGNAVHILKHVSGISSIPELIENTLKFNKSGEADKGFCISQMTGDSGKSIQEVVILCTSSNPICAFKRDRKYYSTQDGYTETEISPSKHAMLCQNAIKLGKDDLNHPLPGVVGRKELLSSISNSDLFYEADSSSQASLKKWSPLIEAFQDAKAKLSFDQAKDFFESSDISKEDKDHFLSLLFLTHPEQGLELVEKLENCSFQAKSWTGLSLSTYAVFSGNLPVIEKLVEKGVDFFERNSKGLSALDYALNKGQWKIADKVLKQQPTSPLKATQGVAEAINKFVKMSKDQEDYPLAKSIIDTILSQININDHYTPFTIGEITGKTNLLGASLLQGTSVENEEVVSLLLASGADPNQGDSLWLAINRGKESLANKLLNAGAYPLKQNSLGFVPIVEAAVRSSPKVLESMLAAVAKKQPEANGKNGETVTDDETNTSLSIISDITDKNHITPLTAAIMSRDQDKIQLLLNKGIGLPSEKESFEMFTGVLKTLISTSDLNTLELLKPLLSDQRVFNELYFSKNFLLENGLFDSSLPQMDPSSSMFAKLVSGLIGLEDLDRLNQHKEQLQSLDFDLLDKSDKRFLIDNELINPEEARIDLESLVEEVEEGVEGSADSDTESDSDSSDSDVDNNA